MTPLYIIAPIVTVAAAVRSTWSPCGWSMLSTLTPLTERARGHRYGATVAWFIAGSTLGGAALGGAAALGALAVSAWAAPLAAGTSVGLAVAAAVLALVAAWDGGVGRPALPHHRRQVNEQWLDEFRPWVYAAGFGLQIGTGLATYIMTAGVYAVVALGSLSGSPLAALGLGVVFGAARGAAVLVSRSADTPPRLAALHRRFAAIEEPVRRAVIAVYAAGAVGTLATAPGSSTALGAGWVLTALALALAAVGVAGNGRLARRPSTPVLDDGLGRT